MGELWYTDASGERKRTAKGVEHESKWKLFSIFLGIFQCSKILGVTFPTMALFEPDGHSPRSGFSPLHITNSSHSTTSITPTKCARIPNVLFRSNETKIDSSVVKLVSVDMVNKNPSVLGLPDNPIVHEIGFMAGIPTIRKIKPLSFIPIFPYIYVYFRMANKFIFIIVERGIDIPIVHCRLRKYAFLGNWRKRHLTSIFPTIILSGVLCSFHGVFVWHRRIITRIQISSNRSTSI